MRRRMLVDGWEVPPPDDSGESDVREVEPGVYSILRQGRSFEARILPAEGGYEVEIGGRRMKVEVRDPRASTRRSASLAGGRQNVTASMPGKVVKVLVELGQEIEAGQGLVVVEAMKMQNEMKAGRSGKVTGIHARDGATVGAGEVLIVIG